MAVCLRLVRKIKSSLPFVIFSTKIERKFDFIYNFSSTRVDSTPVSDSTLIIWQPDANLAIPELPYFNPRATEGLLSCTYNDNLWFYYQTNETRVLVELDQQATVIQKFVVPVTSTCNNTGNVELMSVDSKRAVISCLNQMVLINVTTGDQTSLDIGDLIYDYYQIRTYERRITSCSCGR